MELRDYFTVIRARKWIIIQAIVIVTLSALVVSFLQPKTYEGTAEVLISEKNTAAAILGTVLPELSTQPERAMQTQVQLMQIRPIAEATIRRLNLQTTPEGLGSPWPPLDRRTSSRSVRPIAIPLGLRLSPTRWQTSM